MKKMTEKELFQHIHEMVSTVWYTEALYSAPHVYAFAKYVDEEDPSKDRMLAVNESLARYVGVHINDIVGHHPSKFWGQNWDKFRKDDLRVLRSKAPMIRRPESYGGYEGGPLLVTTKRAAVHEGVPIVIGIAYNTKVMFEAMEQVILSGDTATAFDFRSWERSKERLDQVIGKLDGLIAKRRLAHDNGS